MTLGLYCGDILLNENHSIGKPIQIPLCYTVLRIILVINKYVIYTKQIFLRFGQNLPIQVEGKQKNYVQLFFPLLY